MPEEDSSSFVVVSEPVGPGERVEDGDSAVEGEAVTMLPAPPDACPKLMLATGRAVGVAALGTGLGLG